MGVHPLIWLSNIKATSAGRFVRSLWKRLLEEGVIDEAMWLLSTQVHELVPDTNTQLCNQAVRKLIDGRVLQATSIGGLKFIRPFPLESYPHVLTPLHMLVVKALFGKEAIDLPHAGACDICRNYAGMLDDMDLLSSFLDDPQEVREVYDKLMSVGLVKQTSGGLRLVPSVVVINWTDTLTLGHRLIFLEVPPIPSAIVRLCEVLPEAFAGDQEKIAELQGVISDLDQNRQEQERLRARLEDLADSACALNVRRSQVERSLTIRM